MDVTPAPQASLQPAGLSSAEAAARLRRDGPNRLPQPERRSNLAIVARVLREPMLLLLLAAAGVYLLLGDAGDAVLLGISVVLVIALTVYQEQKAEHALQALRELGSPRARVLRDGEARQVAAQDVVLGDALLVAEGDRLAADARVLEEVDLQVDESLLTGESLPQRRAAGDDTEAARLHAGTLVVRGRGVAEVVAIGERTAIGRIGVSLRDLHPQPTPLQREMRRVVLVFAALALASCVAVVALYVALRGGWLDALLAGLTLAIANIPEEFPVVLAVFLALGAWRMARHKALVRRTPAIEALGATTVLCTDKTGTLTENRMRIAALVAGDERWDGVAPPSPGALAALRIAMLASPPLSHDPMERALHAAWAQFGEPTPLQNLREYGFTPECPAVAAAWAGGESVCVACKGAPETVATLCGLAPAEHARMQAVVADMAARGLRVLGLAAAHLPRTAPLPDTLQRLPLAWAGLVAFADPLRAGVADAVAEARAAGVRVLMLTGDHPQTARAIAREAGIGDDRVVLGAELDAATATAHVDIYARVRPEHKLRLVEALKQRGEVVAMTGDGVNDAPALMAAHVGVAMGGRGTDVAREAAAIVLLDDDFTTIVRAIGMGRAIYDNIRRAVRYILAVHVPITGLALLPMLTGAPMVLLPLHVVFLELIIDPACSIVFEREAPAPDLMRRPPRPRAQRMLDPRTLLASLAQGAGMFTAVAAIHLLAGGAGLAAAQSGALAFTALVAGNLGLILLYRSDAGLWHTLRQRNPAFWFVVALALTVLAAVTWLPPLAAVFRFAAPPLSWWLAALALPLLLAALMKVLAHGWHARHPVAGASTPLLQGEPP
jgi:Ca2+-transporting ATPase